MASGYGESTSTPSQRSSSEAESFECNICFDLAQDPVVTLCGHLFCWPCLYKWLQFHSQSHECPVCKALVVEDKLVPLYGRGKNSTDPRSRSVPAVNIPDRPSGQRPETASPPIDYDQFPQPGMGFMGGGGGWGGFPPMLLPRFGNFTLPGVSSSWGGLLSQLLNFQMLGFPIIAMHGAGGGYYGHGYLRHYLDAQPQPYPRYTNQGQQHFLKLFLIFIGVVVFLFLILA